MDLSSMGLHHYVAKLQQDPCCLLLHLIGKEEELLSAAIPFACAKVPG